MSDSFEDLLEGIDCTFDYHDDDALGPVYDVKSPEPVGSYQFGGCQIDLYEKPCWLHRQMMRVFFGWEWNDA